MTKGYVDTVIGMFFEDKKEEAKTFCLRGLKDQLRQGKVSESEYKEIKEYILSK